MATTCIVCSKELKKVICVGKVKGMVVSFCYDHAAMCDKCEEIYCRFIK